jgi:hypothetical protein
MPGQGLLLSLGFAVGLRPLLFFTNKAWGTRKTYTQERKRTSECC